MGAITETEPGGEMVCILGFSSHPCDVEGRRIPGEWREFEVGERVRFVGAFFKDTPKDNPTGYMAIFEPLDPLDKNRYAATEVYFVSLDCWEGLRDYFRDNLIVIEGRDSPREGNAGVRYKLVQIKEKAGKGPVRPSASKGSGRHNDAIG
jgi:hypothetical protein